MASRPNLPIVSAVIAILVAIGAAVFYREVPSSGNGAENAAANETTVKRAMTFAPPPEKTK